MIIVVLLATAVWFETTAVYDGWSDTLKGGYTFTVAVSFMFAIFLTLWKYGRK